MIQAALALANVTGKRELRRAGARVDRRARPSLLGRGSSAAIISSPTTPRSHRAADQRTRRRDAERERHHGIESDGALLCGPAMSVIASAPRNSCAAFAGAMRRTCSRMPACSPPRSTSMRPASRRADRARGRRREGVAQRAQRRVAPERRGAGGQGQERSLSCGIVAGAWQDRDRRQADGLCVHRPAMLSASDRASGAGGDREGSAADRESSFRVIGRQRATRRIAIPIAMRERRIDALIQKPEVPLALGREALFHQRLDVTPSSCP